MHHIRLLAMIALSSFCAWFIFVVWGLLSPFAGWTLWVSLCLGAAVCLTFLLLLGLACSCQTEGRSSFDPSTAGLPFGAGLGITIFVPISVYAFVAPLLVQRHEYVRVLRKLLWAFGIVGGVLVFLLILSGLLVCAKGRRHGDQDVEPHPPRSITELPDPWLYSQDWAATVGDTVTWDNESVTIVDPVLGTETSSLHLIANKTYQFIIEVQNGSGPTPASAICTGAMLTCAVKTFGIGGAIEEWVIPPGQALMIPDIPDALTDPKPWAKTVDFEWSPTKAGHRCLVITVHPLRDANPANNVGQHNLDVMDVKAGQAFSLTIPVWNRLNQPMEPGITGIRRRGRLRTAARYAGAVAVYPLSRPMLLMSRFPTHASQRQAPYAPPPLGMLEQVEFRLTQWPGRRNPVPAGTWPASVSLDHLQLPVIAWDDATTAATEITLSGVVPPITPIGESREFCVTASAAGRLIGGVNLLTRIV